jgi:heptosyltransferase-3
MLEADRNDRNATVAAPRSILVINVTRIGDTMLVTPAVRALAKAWPQAKIDFAGSRGSSVVFENLAFVRNVRSLKKDTVWLRGWFGRKEYDLALVYGNDGDGPFVRYALRVASKVIAFTQRDESLNRRLFAHVDRSKTARNSVESLLNLLRPLDIPDDGYRLSYAIREREKAWAERKLSGVRRAGAAPIIGLQIASFPTKAYRDWPVSQFVRLCTEIRARHPRAHFLILGGDTEKERTAALQAALPDSSTLLAGTLTLRESAAILGQLDLYVGVDTGPTHIMGALHRPMVALYHPASPSRALAPLEHPCCHTLDLPGCGGSSAENLSMSDLPVEAVLERVEQALRGQFPPPRSH